MINIYHNIQQNCKDFSIAIQTKIYELWIINVIKIYTYHIDEFAME
jgi:hypothetical protein